MRLSSLQAVCKKKFIQKWILDYHQSMHAIKILLIEPNESIAELITKSLQRSFKAEVQLFQTSTEGIESLKKGDNFSLVIARNFSEAAEGGIQDPIAANLLNTVYDLSLKIPLIIIGEFEHTFKKYALVSEPLRLEEVNRLVLKALGMRKEDFEHLKLPDYVPFPLKHFYLMTTSPCDIYIKLLKKTGEEYAKKLNLGESFDKKELQKYEELGVLNFYILKDEYDGFLNALFIQAKMNLKKSTSLEESTEMTGDSFVISSDMMRTLGITPVCIAMVEQTINLMKNQILKTDKLGLLLKKLLDDKMSYSYRHSFLICALSYTLLPKMEWGSGDQQAILLEKICMVSYFHDIYLDDERFLKISDQSQLRKANLTSREMDIVNNHANKAAILIQSYPKLPQGVDMIIKQHHGVSNGVGFPEVLSTTISPMAIFFMVVEDFAINILATSEPAENLAHSMREAIKPLKEKYQLPSYRKIVSEIESLLAPKK
ncbi:MAG: hypothetical protein ACXVLQ_09630 [Bacteriovorax sp.]